jgi:NitT/TauT family transport system permease protein
MTDAMRSTLVQELDDSIDTRTLGRDLVALIAIFMALAVFQVQSPLLLHDTTFGSAFRNATLQPALAVGLALAGGLLIFAPRPRGIAQTAAAVALGVYILYILAAILFGFNLSGALVGLDQEVFRARLTSASPVEALESALTLSLPLIYIALIAIVALWQPWTRLSVYARALRSNAAPLMVALIALALWEALIIVFSIQEFLLPRPSVIGSRLAELYPRLISAGWNTFQNAFWGFAIGSGLGILAGFASARFAGFSRALLPLAIAINAVPIIALAPIMNRWFGELNPASKIAIVALMTFFPAMVSTIKGLTSVDTLSLELMKSYAAGQLETFVKLRLPVALPYIFSALKVGTTLSMIGAIVSEYFGGSTAGLGWRIRDDAGLFKYPEAWSAIVIASAFGILFYVVVSAVERAIMPWHVSFREK